MLVIVDKNTGIVIKRFYVESMFENVTIQEHELGVIVDYLDIEKQYTYNVDTSKFEDMAVVVNSSVKL